MRSNRFLALWLAMLPVASLGAAGSDVRLLDAVKTSDHAALHALLDQRADANAADVDQTTALHWAVQRDDLESTRVLIRAGANVRAANRYGVTALTLACINGSTAIIEALLEGGADANTALPEGETVLMTASRTGKAEPLQLLLARGAAINVKENWRGQTALMWAAAERHSAATRLLLDHGADVGARSKGGLTALLFAVRAGDLESLRLLLDHKADVNDTATDGTSALTLAIINARFDVASMLLDSGANPNATDPRGSALHALAFMRNPGYPFQVGVLPAPHGDSLAVARSLLGHGAQPNARIVWKEGPFDRDYGMVKAPPNIAIGRNYMSLIGATPFYVAAKGGDVALMRVLVAGGADPTLPTRQNVTALMAAAGLGFWDGESPGPESGVPESQSLEAVALALELGNDVNAVADYGDTPPETDGVTLLRRHFQDLSGAIGDMRWSGSTALHGAALRGANSIVRFLMEKGAKIDARNKVGWTPLMIAEGIFVSNTEKAQASTAALLRQLMAEKGIP